MLQIRKLSGLIVVVLVLIGGASCHSKKKAMEASNAAAEKTRIEREQTEKKQKAEEIARQEQEAKDKAARLEEERLIQNEKNRTAAPAVKLEQYFNAISSSTNATSANTSINEALTMFASPQTPVLIVISNSGGAKDYDKPTTIKDYLNYLKDQKKNINSVSEVKTDGAGKITEVELTKN